LTNNGDTTQQQQQQQQQTLPGVFIAMESLVLIANNPIGRSKHHFLSDHFGMSTTFRLLWKAKTT
jgi:hypothetical protein